MVASEKRLNVFLVFWSLHLTCPTFREPTSYCVVVEKTSSPFPCLLFGVRRGSSCGPAKKGGLVHQVPHLAFFTSSPTSQTVKLTCKAFIAANKRWHGEL